MSNLGEATVSAAECVEVNGKVEMESVAAAVSERTVKHKKTTRRKQEVVNAKENGAVEQEAASVAAASLEGTVKCKKTTRSKQEAVNAKENGVVEQEITSAVLARERMPKSKKKEVKAKEQMMTEQEAVTTSACALDETPKCKKEKAKEREEVEQGITTSSVSEGKMKCKKTTRRKQEAVNVKENRTVEQEAASVAAAVPEGTVKCNKMRRKREVANAKENATVEQDNAYVAAAVLEGTVKQKKMRRKQDLVNAKKNGGVEQEAASVVDVATVLALDKSPKCKKEKAKERGMVEQATTTSSVSAKCEEEKANEKGMAKQDATTTTVPAMEETLEYSKMEKANGRGVVEQEATATTVLALEGALKCKKKEKEIETVMHELEPATAISASEGTKKHKLKLKKKNKMQEQQESAQELSGLFTLDKIVISKPGNSGTNGEGSSRDAYVSMDNINVEDPNCSTAKDANDQVKCKPQKENKNCYEKFSSLQEGSEDRERQRTRPKSKRKRDASSRGPDISSQDGGRVAKRCLDSSMDHDLSCICSPSLDQEHKAKVKNIYSPRVSHIRFQRKKLVILDLNGLLADINMDKQNAHMAHAKVKGKLVFRRPYYYDFLRFCFQNFELGIWSSRKMENVNSVVNILMQDLKQYLLFCWDMSMCTFTGRKVIGDKHKPLVLKELKKLWNKEDPNLPWELGEFSPSNTLLVDDSPYKALCNPPHTAIFPQPYSYLNQREDYSLGPGGDLRVYLERLAAADDVQVFVRDNPFGQQSITESDPNWSFYAKIVNNVERGLSMKW